MKAWLIEAFASLVLGTAILGMGVGDAAANSILVFYDGGFSGANYTSPYEADSSVKSQIAAANYFTIHGFPRLAGEMTAPTSWTLGSSALRPTPASPSAVQGVNDDPLIPNIARTNPGTPLTSLVALFTVDSIFGTTGEGYEGYVGQDHCESAGCGGVGALQGNTGFVDVPVALPVPEPASLLLLGAGLVGLAFAARRLGRKLP